MTTYELIVGSFTLLLFLAINFWFGYFVGLEVARKKRKKELINQIKEQEDDKQ